MSYDFGNGFATAIGYQAVNGQEDQGILTTESTDTFALNGSYTGSNYGVSLTYASIEDGEHESLTDNAAVEGEDTYTAIQAYYTPDAEGFPSISVGYEVGEDDSLAVDDEITSFFLGLQWDELGPGSFGLAMGHSNTAESAEEEYMYEAYYSYPVNDGMTITPVVYVQERSAAGVDDETGLMVKTSFSF